MQEEGDNTYTFYPSYNGEEIIKWLYNTDQRMNVRFTNVQELYDCMDFLATFDGLIIYKLKDSADETLCAPFKKNPDPNKINIAATHTSGDVCTSFMHINKVNKEFIRDNLILKVNEYFRDDIKE